MASGTLSRGVRTELGEWYEPVFIATVVVGVVSALLIASFVASSAVSPKDPEPVPEI